MSFIYLGLGKFYYDTQNNRVQKTEYNLKYTRSYYWPNLFYDFHQNTCKNNSIKDLFFLHYTISLENCFLFTLENHNVEQIIM